MSKHWGFALLLPHAGFHQPEEHGPFAFVLPSAQRLRDLRAACRVVVANVVKAQTTLAGLVRTVAPTGAARSGPDLIAQG